VPQQDPLSPPLLALAGALAAIPAVWLALACDAVVAGAAGSLAGFRWTGLSLAPTFTLVAERALDGAHAPTAWVVALFAGPAGAAALGLGAHAVAQGLRGLAWLRLVTFEWASFAVLRLPALLAAAVLPHGRGPLDVLYRRLGEPQSGRWAAGLLALLVLWGACWLVSRMAVETGRDWMRRDGKAFRRHLVRTVAGYPGLVSLAAWSVVVPWAGPLWIGIWLVLTFGVLQVAAP
jgi:hypothetical protein